MPNKYVRTPGSRTYINYSKETLQKAVNDVKQKKLTYRQAYAKYGIPTATISRKINEKHTKNVGGQTILCLSEEKRIVEAILYASDWGFPFEKEDVKQIVKSYLDRAGQKKIHFKNNLPGEVWYSKFIQRHSNQLKNRIGENIKRSRAAVSKTIINEYFDNLEISLSGIPPENIINYDETNFVDDPGRVKVLVRKTSKHADNIMDSTKSATSVMFAVDAAGSMLPLYVVYKSTQLWDSWTNGGPKDCRYNRTPSGWFDQSILEDWFMTIIIPHFRRMEGVKVLIGDNLASHMSIKIIQLCRENNIRFIFLPPNSTHLTQPLDVSCFRPVKIAWRKVLKAHKKTRKGPISKEIFPRLLQKTLEKLSISQVDNIKSGFEATGLYPLNREKVLKRLPDEDLNSINSSASIIIPEALHEIFKETRFGKSSDKISKRKKYNINAGCSVTENNILNENEIRVGEKIVNKNYTDEKNITKKRRYTDRTNETGQNNKLIDYEMLEIEETENKNVTEQNKLIVDCEILEIEETKQNKLIDNYKMIEIKETENKTANINKIKNKTCNNIFINDFVMVQFESIKGNPKLYIGQVSEIDGNEYTCQFLRKNSKMTGFYCFPYVIDEATVSIQEIIKKMKILKQRRGNYQFE